MKALHLCNKINRERCDNVAFGEKLKQLRLERKLGLNQFAMLSGVSASQISRIENGKMATPKVNTIKKLAKGLKFNELELMKMAGYVTDTELPTNALPVDVNNLIDIPVIGTIKAGPNGLAMQDHLGMEFVNKDDIDMSYDYFWLVVSGDSMTGDGIYDKDYAMIKRTTEFNNGDICAVIVDGEEGTLKHVTKSKDSIVLTASNPSYPPRIFAGNDMNEILIAGRLVQTKRKY